MSIGLPAVATVSLPSYNVDISQTTVSGISSGGYMTTQFSVAHSSIVKGVGIVAAGPYDCANGSVVQATGDCMSGSPSASTSINLTNMRAASGLVDGTSNLAKQKVHLFRGYNDGVIRQGVMDAVYGYYGNYTNVYNIMYKNNTKSGHTLPTVSPGNPSENNRRPWDFARRGSLHGYWPAHRVGYSCRLLCVASAELAPQVMPKKRNKGP